MGHELDYARRRKRLPGDLARAIGDAMLRVGTIVIITLMAAAIALSLLRDHYGIERYKDEHYWVVLLNGWGSKVDESATEIIYVWNGRDTHNYFRIDVAAAQACADRCARDYVQVQISYMESARVAHADSSPYLLALQIFTGQDFKDDVHAWRSWSIAHLTEVKGGEGVYRRLQDARLAAAQKTYGIPLPNFRDPRFFEERDRAAYLRDVHGFWKKPKHWLESAALVLYGVAMAWLVRRSIRQRRLKRMLIEEAPHTPVGGAGGAS